VEPKSLNNIIIPLHRPLETIDFGLIQRISLLRQFNVHTKTFNAKNNIVFINLNICPHNKQILIFRFELVGLTFLKKFAITMCKIKESLV
jgi:hypothetical protein